MPQELELQLGGRGREGGGGGQGGSRVQQAAQQAAMRAFSAVKIMFSKVYKRILNSMSLESYPCTPAYGLRQGVTKRCRLS